MSLNNNFSTGYFTVCSINYLPQALVLAKSLYLHQNNKLNIFIIDQKQDIFLSYDFANFEWIEDHDIPNLKILAFIYDVQEFNTSVKPFLALKLLNKYSNVVFLDPDICLYNSLNRIVEKLNHYSVILTPHYVVPKDDSEDMDMMRFGSFNLGFFAVNSSAEAHQFLLWWSKRLLNLCFHEPQFGLSTDQKWISIAPCFFPNLHIEFDLGYNVAFWNLHERDLSFHNNNLLVNNTFSLVFFHYSNFDRKNPKRISKRLEMENFIGNTTVQNLCYNYAKELNDFDDKYFSKIKYSFNYMNNGTYISPTTRRAFASVSNRFAIDFNPFEMNKVMLRFLTRNYLIQKDNKEFVSLSFNDVKVYNNSFRLIYIFLRIVLRIIGPNNFFNLSRLMVFLSSFRQNRDMWKI